jgi:hypothetical protein
MLPDTLYFNEQKYAKELPAPVLQLYRVPHDIERYNVDVDDFRYAGARVGVVRKKIRESSKSRPEIFRVNPDHTTRLGEGHQWLWKNINPELSNMKIRTLYGNYLAWTNQSGFPGRRDYVNRMDMDKGLPNFDAPRVNGGQILEGVEDGEKVWLKSLLITDPIPSTNSFLESGMWAWGISISPRGNIYYINRLGIDGTYKKVRIPFITAQRVWLPKNELHKLSQGELPNPTWIIGDPI